MQNLVICNAGLSTGLDQTALVSEFSKFGALSDVCLLRDKSYCFVICADDTNAKQIYEGTHAKSLLGQNETVIYLTYCTEGLHDILLSLFSKQFKENLIICIENETMNK